jgi:hypothetical protein
MGARRFLFLESQRDSETNAGQTDSRILGAPNFVGNEQPSFLVFEYAVISTFTARLTYLSLNIMQAFN